MKLQFGKTINVIILSKMQRGERGGEQAGEGSRRERGAGERAGYYSNEIIKPFFNPLKTPYD